jgi:hypothetical protein
MSYQGLDNWITSDGGYCGLSEPGMGEPDPEPEEEVIGGRCQECGAECQECENLCDRCFYANEAVESAVNELRNREEDDSE